MFISTGGVYVVGFIFKCVMASRNATWFFFNPLRMPRWLKKKYTFENKTKNHVQKNQEPCENWLKTPSEKMCNNPILYNLIKPIKLNLIIGHIVMYIYKSSIWYF